MNKNSNENDEENKENEVVTIEGEVEDTETELINEPIVIKPNDKYENSLTYERKYTELISVEEALENAVSIYISYIDDNGNISKRKIGEKSD